ncbi:MAG: serine hydrolase domain-containing protein, partial [Steroidobacteraceae bacterium]
DDPEGPSVASYVRKMCLLPSLYPPGEGPVTYCNSGFVVAGRIVEVLTGKTWQNAVMTHICRPLAMPAAFAHPQDALRFRCAMGHVSDPKDFHKVVVAPATFLAISAAPAGSVLSMSAESLLLFAKAHMADGTFGDGRRLLSAESARAMREAVVDVPPFSIPGITHWGLGWLLGQGPDYPDYGMAGHDGGTLGQYTLLRTFPEKGVAFTLLTNSPSPAFIRAVESDLAAALVGATMPQFPPPQAFEPSPERYIGDYENVGGCIVVRGASGGELTMTVVSAFPGQPQVTVGLEPYAPDVFALRSDNPMHRDQKACFRDSDSSGRAAFLRLGLRMARRVPG